MSLKQRKIDSLQIPFEIDSLQMVIANSRPKVILELGSHMGGSLSYFLQIKNIELVVSIDKTLGIHGGIILSEQEKLKEECDEYCKKYNIAFHQLLMDSHEQSTKENLKNILSHRRIDAFFCDGDHTLNGVSQDFEMYAPLVKDGGIIGFHDILNSQYHELQGAFVHVFWNEVKKFFKHEEYITDNKEDYKTYMPESYNYGGFGGIGILHYAEEGFKNYLAFKNMKKNVSIVIGALNNYDKLETCVKSIENNKSDNVKIEEIINNTKINKPRVAVCISGQIRTLKTCWESIKENIIIPLEADVFLKSWRLNDRLKEKEIIELLQPKKFEFEIFDYRKEVELSKPQSNYANKKAMFYNIYKCNELRLAYEKEHNINYDVIIRIRTDMIFKSVITKKHIQEIREKTLYIPNFHHYGGYNDHISIADSETMNLYCNCVNDLDTLQQYSPECSLMHYLNKLPITVQEVDYIHYNVSKYDGQDIFVG